MRPLTILALMATAGASVASPLPPVIENVVHKVTSGHRRSDSTALEVTVEGFKKQNKLVDIKVDGKHEGMHHRSVSVDVDADVVAQVKSPSRSRAHIQRGIINVLPSQAPGSNAGLVDVHTGADDAHLIQTPGKDKTIVDINPGPVDAKVNLPTEGPAKDAVHDTPGAADHAFNGVGKNLAGKKGGPLDGVANDGKGGPQGLEIAIGSDDRDHKSSSAAPSSSASRSQSHSSAHPSSSAASRSASAHSSSAHPTSSPSRGPARSSASSSASRSAPPASSSASASRSSSSAQPSQSGDGAILPGALAAAKLFGKVKVDSIKPLVTVDTGHKAVGSALGQDPKGPNDHTSPARIEFGKLPKNTVPCDGVNIRDKGELVDVCIKVALLDQRPQGYDACPDTEAHNIDAHADTKDITHKVSKDVVKVVKLCADAGLL